MFPAYANLSAYERHKKLINDYFLTREGSAITLKRDTSRDKTDADVIREEHKFLWDDDDAGTDWGSRLAKKYYDKLFKEYCICDLTQYKKNKVALRWRTENEVVVGKGQFQCGNRRCDEKADLKTWEVNFGYVEKGEKKNALVKLRLCPTCSLMLNHHSKKREVKRKKSLKRLGIGSSEVGDVGTSSEPDVTIVKIEKEDGETEKEKKDPVVEEKEIWKDKKLTESQEKSRDEEFDDYFDDLFV